MRAVETLTCLLSTDGSVQNFGECEMALRISRYDRKITVRNKIYELVSHCLSVFPITALKPYEELLVYLLLSGHVDSDL